MLLTSLGHLLDEGLLAWETCNLNLQVCEGQTLEVLHAADKPWLRGVDQGL